MIKQWLPPIAKINSNNQPLKLYLILYNNYHRPTFLGPIRTWDHDTNQNKHKLDHLNPITWNITNLSKHRSSDYTVVINCLFGSGWGDRVVFVDVAAAAASFVPVSACGCGIWDGEFEVNSKQKQTKAYLANI